MKKYFLAEFLYKTIANSDNIDMILEELSDEDFIEFANPEFRTYRLGRISSSAAIMIKLKNASVASSMVLRPYEDE